MAATKCNISFDIDYTSSKPIIKAVASYKIKNSSSTVSYTDYTIPLPTVPYTGNSLSVSLPDIQAQGDYDLVVALTDSDNFVATQSGSFKIGNCSGNIPPKVSIKWSDNSGTEARMCEMSPCADYTISVESSDADNDIVKREVLISFDNGNTWTIYNSDLSTNTDFSTGALSSGGTRLFKVVVTDSAGNTAESNMLSYTKKEKISDRYRIAVPAEYSETGWNPSGGTATYQGFLEFKFNDVLNVTNGFIRLMENGDNNEFGLQRINGLPIIINKIISVQEMFRQNLFSSCTAQYHCIPVVNIAEYKFEFSSDEINWQQFIINFYM